jgi:hypothetical protein
MVNDNRGGNSCGAHLAVHHPRRRFLDLAHYCNHLKFHPNSFYMRTPLCPLSRSKLVPLLTLASRFASQSQTVVPLSLTAQHTACTHSNPSDEGTFPKLTVCFINSQRPPCRLPSSSETMLPEQFSRARCVHVHAANRHSTHDSLSPLKKTAKRLCSLVY